MERRLAYTYSLVVPSCIFAIVRPSGSLLASERIISMKRRLSAILAADMVGYSRLVEVDEIGTLERHRAFLDEIIAPAIDSFNGRLVKEMGDGILSEFPSVIEAVRCAIHIQRKLPLHQQAASDHQRIEYRIGINLGDIVAEGQDIFGDGVNVAARLEALADPGGVCISGTVFDHLKSQIDATIDPLGEVKVKNIETPIRVYKVRISESQSKQPTPKLRTRRTLIASAGLLISILAGALAPTLVLFLLPDRLLDSAKSGTSNQNSPHNVQLHFSILCEILQI